MSTFYINPASACQNTKSGFFQPPFRHGSTRIDLASPICIQTRRCATDINLDKIPHKFKAVLELLHTLLTLFMRFQNQCLMKRFVFSGVPIDFGNFEGLYLENQASYESKKRSKNELLFSPLSNGVNRLLLALSVAEQSPFSRLVQFLRFSQSTKTTGQALKHDF